VGVITRVERGDLERKRENFLCPLSLGEKATDILVTCSKVTKMERGIFEK
jgi:hypothetical protein